MAGNGLSLNGQFEDVIGSELSDNIRGDAADNRLDGGEETIRSLAIRGTIS